MYGDASAVAPVVFACNLGTPLVNDTFRKELGQFSYMISQTPQVWNDFQSYEDENGVQLTWDSVDKLFPENMIPDMLECFENLLHELGKKDWNQRFDVLPEKRKREIEDTARTGVPERVECLHWAVMNHAEVCPEDIALIDAGSGRSVSYGELKARATAVAAGISEKDIKGVPVALTLPRGIEQIEAALGILLSGNSYLPVSLSQPKDRRALIHEKTGVRYVVTNRELSEKLDWPEGTEILVMEGMEEGQENVRLPEVSPKDSAYIIMTSGSTGVPKGVEIAHESAWNTVQDASLECAIHVLYDGIDILGCALGGLSTWKLGNVAESYTTSMAGGGNRVISGIIGMVPVTFIVNTNVDRNDIDHPLHLYHRIELTFSTGRLCLVNTHGPVIWLPFLHMPRDEYGTLSINVEEEVNIPSGVTIGNVMLPSVKETFEQIWPDAVKKALEILFKQNRTEKMSMAQYQIYVSKLWSEICQKVGYMNIVDYDNFGDIKSIFYDLEKRHLIKKENDGIE